MRGMPRIVAPFTIAARPSHASDAGPAPALDRTTFDKVFTGERLVGTSVVELVSVSTGAGPLAYVALERVDAELEGRAGAFVLRHVGTITASGPMLDLRVVEGSGTEGLTGITGVGSIQHTPEGARLELDYEL